MSHGRDVRISNRRNEERGTSAAGSGDRGMGSWERVERAAVAGGMRSGEPVQRVAMIGEWNVGNEWGG